MIHIAKLLIIILFVVLLFKDGPPFVKHNIVEEISPAIFWSMQRGEDDKIEISTVVPPVSKEQKNVLSLEISLLKEAKKHLTWSISENCN
ncbi:hypothetical protein G4V62_14630 [Bacillaceae bacterium SIJ1]|uniref:hypothetical protein n=1 Tax=Litoribacterium kuwaitense TaxID=1398745 RepID=UPI0013EAE4C9|nr:hypothetical protein [Litoribacterium kuwaitense]NGP46125.1 hypothetical protein [Litoribacterium kuwaitense]